MKAAIHQEYGLPEVIQVKEVEKPVPKDNELLIKVHSTTFNRTDCAMVTGKPFVMRLLLGLSKPRNPQSGTDFAGTVESVGKAVTEYKTGDKVFGFNDAGLNSHAEWMTISADKAIATIPDHVSFEHAAAGIEGAHYAINIINKVNLKKGQSVLVNGATGAIGSALVQLLKNMEMSITATCSTKNIELVKSLGANQVIDYTKTDFTRLQEKFDYVFDSVGKSSFGKCKRILNPRGVYISSELGWMAENLLFVAVTPLLGGKKVKFPYPANKQGSVNFVKNLLAEGKFKPVIDKTYPLENIAEAFRYVLTGEKIGNVIVKIDPNS